MTQVEKTQELIDLFLSIINDEELNNEGKAKKCVHELAMECFTIAEMYNQITERAFWIAIMDEL